MRDSRTGQRLSLALLFAAGVVNFFDRTALSVANTSVRAEMHLSATSMGWLLSAFSFAYGLAQLPLVAVLRRTGPRAVLGTGLVLWSTAQALTGFVGGMPTFLALRAVLGVGESPFYPCGVQVIREWFSDKTRGRATAVMNMSQTLGLAAAPPLLAWWLLRFGWRSMFVVLGLAGLLVGVLWVALYRSPVAVDGEQPKAKHTGSWTVLLRYRMVWGMMLGFGGVNYTNWLYTSWLPGYLQAAHHLSLGKAGWFASVPFLSGAAGMLASGMTTDLLHRRGVPLTRAHRGNLIGGMLLSAASTFLVAQSATAMQAVAGVSAALFCIHFAGTSGWGYAQEVAVPELVGSLGALQNFGGFVLASAAPVITGALLDRTHSFTLALGICTAVTVVGALSYATLAAPTTDTRLGWSEPVL